MSNIKNKVQLIGNLGRDPEFKALDGGRSLAKFSLATSESYKNSKGEWITDTSWHNLIAWGKTAEYAEANLKKGSEIAIEGKLVSRSYEDKEGKKIYITEVVVNQIMPITKKEKALDEQV
jgi:single-strand DNA-binding protein